MTLPTDVALLGADDIRRLLAPHAAVNQITRSLRTSLDVESDMPRLFSPVRSGEFLLMPSQTDQHAGIKVVTVAPENPSEGLPKIQAWYLLFDGVTLRPQAILEGAELTLLRTPAVTVTAIREMLAADPRKPREAVEHLVVFGSGPQAESHVHALRAVMPVARVTVIGRTAERVQALVERLQAAGVDAVSGEPSQARTADVVITATSSSTPVVSGEQIAPDAVVAAIGAHGLECRELGEDLVRDADVIVEARAAALRESGTLLQARPETEWQTPEHSPVNLQELVRDGMRRRPGHPVVYVACGMSWEDLVLVESIMERWHQTKAEERP